MSFSEPLNSRRSVRRRAASLPRDYRERCYRFIGNAFITHSFPVTLKSLRDSAIVYTHAYLQNAAPFTRKSRSRTTWNMEEDASWNNAIKYTGDRERGQVEIVRLKYSIESYVYELIIPKGGRMEGKSWNASSKGRGCDAPFRWL